MTRSRFFRYELRTTDTNAARAFYSDVFGPDFWSDGLAVVPLPEAAAARGAPANWLGYIGVPDVDQGVRHMLAAGAQQLGPPRRGAGESMDVVVRDPFGAVVALGSEAIDGRQGAVAWHLHNGDDHERTFALYGGLFNWTPTAVADLGPDRGTHQVFSWEESGRAMGSMSNMARLPHVHPHWLFCFPVADIADRAALVRALGGTALEPVRSVSDETVVPCEDPQGAAFALFGAR